MLAFGGGPSVRLALPVTLNDFDLSAGYFAPILRATYLGADVQGQCAANPPLTRLWGMSRPLLNLVG